MYRMFNPNPHGKRVGDCVVRALCKATGQSWESVMTCLFVKACDMGDMPSSDVVWGAWLRSHGWERNIIEDTCPNCYTVAEFCSDHPDGTYVLALGGHVVCAENGDYYDTWDSGDRTPLYYYSRRI